MPPCISPRGCLRLSRTWNWTCADSGPSSSHSSSRKPSNVCSRGIRGDGRLARSQGAALTAPPGAARNLSPGPQHDRLGLRVVVEGLLAVLLAVAARLPAAERQLVVDLGPRVDPGVAGFDAGCRLACSLQVAGPHRRAETERRGVG